MIEIGGAIAWRYLAQQSTRDKCTSLEIQKVNIFGHFLHMIVHVEQRCSNILYGGETLSVFSAAVKFLNKFLWHNLTRLVVLGINLQHLRSESPVLVNLRGKLYEIAWNTRYTLIVNVLEEIVKGMSKLMEHGTCLVGTEQSRLSGCRLGEVANYCHHWCHLLAVLVRLAAISATPCPTPLRGSWEEIEEQYAKQTAISVAALERLCVGMWQRNVFQRLECYSIEAVGTVEHSVAHVVQLKIRAKLVLVEAVFCTLGTVGIVAPVPALSLKVASVFCHLSLNVGKFFLCLCQCGFPHLVEQFIYGVRGFCHSCVECHGGIILESHKMSLLGTHFQQSAYNVAIVVCVSVASAACVALEHSLTQLTSFGILQERHHARVVESEHPLAFQSRLLG